VWLSPATEVKDATAAVAGTPLAIPDEGLVNTVVDLLARVRNAIPRATHGMALLAQKVSAPAVAELAAGGLVFAYAEGPPVS
jgi:hypothetical protein